MFVLSAKVLNTQGCILGQLEWLLIFICSGFSTTMLRGGGGRKVHGCCMKCVVCSIQISTISFVIGSSYVCGRRKSKMSVCLVLVPSIDFVLLGRELYSPVPVSIRCVSTVLI